jgi:DNA-3-methyladenine glycosylase
MTTPCPSFPEGIPLGENGGGTNRFTARKLPRSFYLRPTLTVARDLLGKYFVRESNGETLIGMIVEVEAYLGLKDPASHTYRGKTKRNEVMFKKGGHLYVYFTYGMHFCANIVTEDEGIGHAVLLRAIEPVKGIEIMRKNRGFETVYNKAPALLIAKEKQTSDSTKKKHDLNLTNGPAKLCEAMDIHREQNGTDLLGEEIYLTKGISVKKSQVLSSQRIGITQAKEKRWRFYLKGNKFVSR